MVVPSRAYTLLLTTTGVAANGQGATIADCQTEIHTMAKVKQGRRILTRAMLLRVCLGVARIASAHICKPIGDKSNYLGYQEPVIRTIIDMVHNALKMPRQTGKTWIAAVIAVAYLICGIDVLVAYPTLQQGYKLLLSQIADICRLLGLSLLKDNSSGIECANGARVDIVSTNEVSKASRGYSPGLLIIDESQDADIRALDKLLPSLKRYVGLGLATTLIMGTGGGRTKMLETSWRDNDFNLIHLSPDHIIAIDPAYKVADDEFKRILSPEGYRVECLCELIEGGNSAIYKNIHTPLPDTLTNTLNYYDTVGIDIGQTQDSSIITHLKFYPGTVPRLEVAETLRLNQRYNLQCPIMRQWILDRGLESVPIRVEVNGVGRPIFDYLSHNELSDPRPLLFVRPFVCTKNDKRALIQRLQHYDYACALHVTDVKASNALDGLEQVVNDAGDIKFDHSDYNSSLICAVIDAGQPPPLEAQRLMSTQ